MYVQYIYIYIYIYVCVCIYVYISYIYMYLYDIYLKPAVWRTLVYREHLPKPLPSDPSLSRTNVVNLVFLCWLTSDQWAGSPVQGGQCGGGAERSADHQGAGAGGGATRQGTGERKRTPSWRTLHTHPLTLRVRGWVCSVASRAGLFIWRPVGHIRPKSTFQVAQLVVPQKAHRKVKKIKNSTYSNTDHECNTQRNQATGI